MFVCRKCGRDNEDHFNFCLSCGANLKVQRSQAEEERLCASCRSPVPVSHMFCGQCGARMDPRLTADSPAVPALAEGERERKAETRESSPHAPERARLVLINPDGSTNQSIPLLPGRNIFGRMSGPRVFREDSFLSPQHVAFDLDEEVLSVEDLDSLNGIYVRLVEPTPLVHLDQLRVGRQVLTLELFHPNEPLSQADAQGTRILGGPIEQAWGRLVRFSDPDRSSQAYLLSRPEEIIGRERGTVILRDDGFVSGRHARLTSSREQVAIEDLKSSNGTFLRIRQRYEASDGDLFLVGQQPLRLYLGE